MSDKLQELEAIEQELKAIAREMKSLIYAINNEEIFHNGQLTALSLGSIMDRSRLAFERFKGAEASQKAYENLLKAAQESLEKRAVAEYADLLVTAFRNIQNTALKELQKVSADNGTRELEGARKVARAAGVPSDIIERVYTETISKAQEIKEQVKNERSEGAA